MKKILTVAAFAVLGLTNMHAQEVNFGVKGGINLANFAGDNSKSFDQVTAFNFGAMAEIKLSEKFSFQPELLFSGQGTSIDDATLEMRYLNLPLMAKYYATKGLSFEAGPQVGFLASAKMEGVDVKKNFKSFDLGFNIGLGYKLQNGLNFGLRSNVGLTNINDVKGISSKNRNSVFQASVGYFFL